MHLYHFIRGPLLAVGLIAAPVLVTAQVPNNVTYQGYLADTNGQAVNAPVAVSLSLYANAAGGAPLWSEDYVITPTEGVFNIILGDSQNPFPANLFEGPLFLGIRVEGDSEMVPRTELTTAPFSHKAADAGTLTGRTASDLDQSSDVTTLQSDLANVESDISSIESTLPTLQSRVAGSCAAGSAIRQISSAGTVTCETDDEGHWSKIGDSIFYSNGNIGVGTSSPAAAIQIDAPDGTDPFRARVQATTKLRVHSNGSVSVGTSSAGPQDGLHVNGATGIGTTIPAAKVTSTDPLWQLQLDNNGIGGNDWFLGSSATDWAIGGGKFVISTNSNSNNSAFVIDNESNVGIGVLSPEIRLHVDDGNDVAPSGGGFLALGDLGSTNVAIDNNEIMARNNGAVAPLSLNADGGEVRINTNGSRDSDALEIRGRVLLDNGGNGGMRFTGTNSNPTNALLEPTSFEEGLVGVSARPFWRMYSREFYASTPLEYRTYSDESLKHNVVPIPNAIETVMALDGVAYELTDRGAGKRVRKLTEDEQFRLENQLGFIAQDVEQVLPQLVSEDEFSGLKTVGYMGLIPILVEAMKQQQRQIETLETRLEMLSSSVTQ